MSLEDFAASTDKRADRHNYVEFYDEIISDPGAILEIGIARGGSLKMWEGAFPSSVVVGIDINPSPKTDWAVTYQMDVRDPTKLAEVCRRHGPFDIVIDDGAHTPETVQAVKDVVWPRWIKPGGWFVVEDVNCPRMTSWVKTQLGYVSHHGQLVKNTGPKFWGNSRPSDIETYRMVLRPGIVAFQRRTP